MTREDSFDNYRLSYPDGKKSNHTWGGRLAKIAKTVPDKTALIQGDKKVSWRELEQRVNRLAHGLLSLGLQKEDRVAIMGFNSFEWMESFFAVSRIGAVPVNLNPRFVVPEIKHVLEDADATALIFEAEYQEAAKAVQPELPLLKHLIAIGGRSSPGVTGYEELMAQHPETPPQLAWPVTNDDFAFLFYTGGTTGYPKGTVWDYYNRVRGLDAIMITALKPLIKKLPDLPSEAFPPLLSTLPIPLSEGIIKSRPVRWLIKNLADSERRDLRTMKLFGSAINYRLAAGKMKLIVVAPLFHGAAWITAFSMIGASAGTCIFLESRYPFDPAEFWRTVEKHKANLALIVGDAFAIPMIEELERKDYDIRSMATIISSGVRFSPAIKKRFLKKHPGLVILDELGSTETSAAYAQVASSDDQDISNLKISITREGVNVNRVVNPLTGEDVKPGEKGELIFGGFNSLGYWKDPERTRKYFRQIDGRSWFFIGDEGTVDEEGYFQFIGRGSSIINTGGEKVYAEEVEEILMQHPNVRDAAVTGAPDPRWGESVTALIEPAAGADLVPEEIIEFCRERMAGYKKPKQVILVEEIPRTATGKLERKELKERVKKMVEEQK